jgi:hypothetical protein
MEEVPVRKRRRMGSPGPTSAYTAAASAYPTEHTLVPPLVQTDSAPAGERDVDDCESDGDDEKYYVPPRDLSYTYVAKRFLEKFGKNNILRCKNAVFLRNKKTGNWRKDTKRSLLTLYVIQSGFKFYSRKTAARGPVWIHYSGDFHHAVRVAKAVESECTEVFPCEDLQRRLPRHEKSGYWYVRELGHDRFAAIAAASNAYREFRHEVMRKTGNPPHGDWAGVSVCPTYGPRGFLITQEEDWSFYVYRREGDFSYGGMIRTANKEACGWEFTEVAADRIDKARLHFSRPGAESSFNRWLVGAGGGASGPAAC